MVNMRAVSAIGSLSLDMIKEVAVGGEAVKNVLETESDPAMGKRRYEA